MVEPEDLDDLDDHADLDDLLRAVASGHRRHILVRVWDRERSAGDLAELLELAPASVSEHLRVLRKHGLVAMRVDGTFRLYRAVPERLGHLVELLTRVFPGIEPAGEGGHSQEVGG
ncbi:DNA-binding transcriptional ArsR family regulator [Catenulispora sp. MAP5-51]|uniref:ArsR/SmtB family transcription factor n=1 Tax=Catenulispora sp. MAP5-51 TaxID=3156298 RepID=UPI0035183B1C